MSKKQRKKEKGKLRKMRRLEKRNFFHQNDDLPKFDQNLARYNRGGPHGDGPFSPSRLYIKLPSGPRMLNIGICHFINVEGCEGFLLEHSYDVALIYSGKTWINCDYQQYERLTGCNFALHHVKKGLSLAVNANMGWKVRDVFLHSDILLGINIEEASSGLILHIIGCYVPVGPHRVKIIRDHLMNHILQIKRAMPHVHIVLLTVHNTYTGWDMERHNKASELTSLACHSFSLRRVGYQRRNGLDTRMCVPVGMEVGPIVETHRRCFLANLTVSSQEPPLVLSVEEEAQFVADLKPSFTRLGSLHGHKWPVEFWKAPIYNQVAKPGDPRFFPPLVTRFGYHFDVTYGTPLESRLDDGGQWYRPYNPAAARAAYPFPPRLLPYLPLQPVPDQATLAGSSPPVPCASTMSDVPIPQASSSSGPTQEGANAAIVPVATAKPSVSCTASEEARYKEYLFGSEANFSNVTLYMFVNELIPEWKPSVILSTFDEYLKAKAKRSVPMDPVQRRKERNKEKKTMKLVMSRRKGVNNS